MPPFDPAEVAILHLMGRVLANRACTIQQAVMTMAMQMGKRTRRRIIHRELNTFPIKALLSPTLGTTTLGLHRCRAPILREAFLVVAA